MLYGDIDWFQRELIVSRSVNLTKVKDQSKDSRKHMWEIGSTKNGRTRRVGVGDELNKMFSSRMRETCGNPEDFVLAPKDIGLKGDQGLSRRYGLGEAPFISPDYFDDSIYGPVAEAAGLNATRFHDLRHFFASILIGQGESPKYICDQMGHSSIQVTFVVYGHLFPQCRKEVSSRLEQTILAQRPQTANGTLKTSTSNLCGSPGSRAPVLAGAAKG